MIHAQAKHTVKQARQAPPGLVLRMVKILNSTDIFIGIPQAENREHGKAAEKGITNAELLFVQEHGVRRSSMRAEMEESIASGRSYRVAHDLYIHEHGSPLWQIPPRPVLQPAMAAAHDRLAKLYRLAVEDAWSGRDPRPALERVGAAAAYAVQKWFRDPRNNWAPDAPSTVEKKGSDRPLIDTGELRRSITYELRPKQ